MPTLVRHTGFEHGTLSAAAIGSLPPLFDAITGTPTVVAANARTGTRSLRVNKSATTAVHYVTWSVTGKVGVARLYLRPTTNPAGGSEDVCGFRDASLVAAQLSVLVRSTGVFRGLIWDGVTTTTQDSAISAGTGAYKRIDMLADVSGNTWTLDWAIDGVAQTRVSFAKGSPGPDFAQFDMGCISEGSANTIDWNIDDAAVSGTAGDYPCGAGYSLGYAPNADGAHVLDAATSAFFFTTTNDGTTPIAVTSSTTDSYQKIDEWPVTTGAGADAVGIRGAATITPQTAGAKAAGTTGARSVSLPTGVEIDDICILVATTVTAGSVTISTAGGGVWNLMAGFPLDVGTDDMLYVWWRRHASGDSAPSVTPGGDHVCAGITSYRGCVSTGTPFEQLVTGTEATSDTSFSFVTGGTTTKANCQVVGICSTGADANTAQFSTMTNAALSGITEEMDYCTTSGGGGGFALCDGLLAAAGSMGTWASTLSTASKKNYCAFALIPMGQPTGTEYVEHTFAGSTELVRPLALTVIHALRNQSGTAANSVGAKVSDDGVSFTDLYSAQTIGVATLGYVAQLLIAKPSGGDWWAGALNSLLQRFGYSTDANPVARLDAAMVEVAYGHTPVSSLVHTDRRVARNSLLRR